MDYQKTLAELENLVLETYGLWDHNRVGFQWRHYTWNHTKPVSYTHLTLPTILLV